MKAIERRMSIMKHLCYVRYSQIQELAEMYNVSIRTIQRDILEISSFIPIDTRAGRHDGGLYVLSDFYWNRMYMSNEEIELLQKIKKGIDDQKIIYLDDDEKDILISLIKIYTKPSK